MVKKKEKPLNREDVLKLIEENGGKAEGLDLSGKEFEEGVDLSELDLSEIILEEAELENVNFRSALLGSANLQKANLCDANLQGAKCGGIDLRNAVLITADLRGAIMAGADMRGAYFSSILFNKDTDFINVKWGKRCVPKWLEFTAGRTYRELKNWHNEAGMYDIAGEFYYKEMTARKSACWLRQGLITWSREGGFVFEDRWSSGRSRTEYLKGYLSPFKPRELLRAIYPKKPFLWIWYMLFELLCGYGEKPFKVVISAIVVVLGLAIIYLAIGTLTPNTFLNSLYYSAVSFTALGYGSWAPEPTGWVKGLGAFEAFAGVFMMALFLVTFVRKMTR